MGGRPRRRGTSTPGLATPYYSAVDLLALADRGDDARRAIDRTIGDARRRGSLPHVAFALGVRAAALARDGETCLGFAKCRETFAHNHVIVGKDYRRHFRFTGQRIQEELSPPV